MIDQEQFSRRESKFLGATFAGLEYNSELSGPTGAHFTLFAVETTTAEQIVAAKHEARRDHDVTGFSIHHVPQAWLDAESFTPTESADSWVNAVRWIVERKTMRRIDLTTNHLVPEEKRGGTPLDLFSASVMLKIHDGLNTTNKTKFAAMPLMKAHDVAFALCDKINPI